MNEFNICAKWCTPFAWRSCYNTAETALMFQNYSLNNFVSEKNFEVRWKPDDTTRIVLISNSTYSSMT